MCGWAGAVMWQDRGCNARYFSRYRVIQFFHLTVLIPWTDLRAFYLDQRTDPLIQSLSIRLKMEVHLLEKIAEMYKNCVRNWKKAKCVLGDVTVAA